MDPTAGFGISIVLGQQTLQNLVSVLHHENAIPHQIQSDLGLASLDLFLDVPQLGFAAENRTQVEIGLQAWGPMTVSSTGESPTIVMRSQVLADLKAVVQIDEHTDGSRTTSLVFVLGGQTATLTSISVEPIVGTLSSAVQDYLASPAFHDAAQNEIRNLLAGLSVFPPLALDALSLAPTTSVTASPTRTLDGALAIGIDLKDPSFNLDTHGNADGLNDMRAGFELAVHISAVAVPVQLSQYLSAAAAAIAAQGATLKSLKLKCTEGTLHFDGVVNKDSLDVTFSVDGIPRTIRTDVPVTSIHRHELWLDFVDLQVGVDRPWYQLLCEAFGGELSLWVTEGLLQMVRNLGSTLIGGNLAGTQPRPVTFYYTLPNTTKPLIKLAILAPQFHSTGFFIGLSLEPQLGRDFLNGPLSMTLDDLRRANAPFSTSLPFGTHPSDPQLVVRWIVKRFDNGVVVLDETLPTLATYGPTDRLSLGLTSAQAGALVGAGALLLSVNISRSLGATTTNLFSDNIIVGVWDPIQKTHPYVHWKHSVTVPIVSVGPNGSQHHEGKRPGVAPS